MNKLRKAAVVVAVLGSVGLLGVGPAYAGGGMADDYTQQSKSSDDNYGKSGGDSYGKSGGGYGHGKSAESKIDIRQGSSCRSEDVNVDVLGEVGIANGLAGNLGGGEGHPGSQHTAIGSSVGCNNSIG